jgi:branched-subunit amino acid ABC-type transport system permease component
MTILSDYAHQLLASMGIAHLYSVLGLLWPFTLTLAVAAIRWKHLSSKGAFVLLGVVASFGVHLLLSELARYVFWQGFMHEPPQDYVLLLRFTDPKVIAVIATMLSIPLVLWLAALLNRPLTSNNRWRAP